MDSIEFLLIIAVFVAVLFWYLQNAEAKSEGLLGLFALRDDPEAAKGVKKRAYRIKKRADRGKPSMRDIRVEKNRNAAYRLKGADEADRAAQMRRRFRRQDEARYRVKDKAAKYKALKDPADED